MYEDMERMQDGEDEEGGDNIIDELEKKMKVESAQEIAQSDPKPAEDPLPPTIQT